MKVRDFKLFFFVFFVVILLTACSKEDLPPTPPNNNDGKITTEPVISLNLTNDTISAEAGSTEISLKANCTWNAFSDALWLDVIGR